MKFLRSYSGAMVVMVLVIALSILGGSHRSLVRERGKVEALFSAPGGSIATDLEARRATAANLVTVAGRYLGEAETADLSACLRELERADGPAACYAWDQALTEAADGVFAKLEETSLTQQDADYIQGFRTDLAARADTIARDGYNAAVDDFNQRVLGAFPANLLSRITFVRGAEAFR